MSSVKRIINKGNNIALAEMRDCACQVCGVGFERALIKFARNNSYMLCDACTSWHKWCSRGKHFPLRSEFAVNNSVLDGLQDRCRSCNAQGFGRILECVGCELEFLVLGVGKGSRFNGRSAPLCDECYETVKHCSDCDTVKPREEFAICEGKANGRVWRCKECIRASWHELTVAEKFEKHQGVRFGMSYDDYLAMNAAQGGRCAICNLPETDIDTRTGDPFRLSIDHCHATGIVRSLLCSKCNKAIGLMAEDVERLGSAIEYLNKWSILTAK